MHTVDLSDSRRKVGPNCIETIVATIPNRREGLRYGIWVRDSSLSIVAVLAVSRDFL